MKAKEEVFEEDTGEDSKNLTLDLAFRGSVITYLK